MATFELQPGAGFDLQAAFGQVANTPVIAATLTGDWAGEVELEPTPIILTATLVGDWAGEVELEPTPVNIGTIAAQIAGDWSGEVELEPAISSGTVAATLTGDWSGEVELAPAPIIATIRATLGGDWRGEVELAVPANESGVVEDTFLGLVRLWPAERISGTALEQTAYLEMPYPDSETESFQSRLTVTPTFRGAHIEDSGVYDEGREMSFTLEGASREQTDYANLLYVARDVVVAHWDGFYSAKVDRVSTINQKLEIDLIVVERLRQAA